MKILSDNTADRILRHLAGEGTPPRVMTPRAAPSSAPARLWQIHVVPATGEVTVDAGRAICEDGWHEVAASSPGTAEGGEYVVCSIGEDGAPAVTLAADLADVSGPFAVIGRVLQSGDSVFFVEQYVSNPIILHLHWGDKEDPAETTPWAAPAADASDARPLILPIVSSVDVEGKSYTQHTAVIDTRGNVRIVGDPEEKEADGEEETDPPKEPPHCGHPLNEPPDDDNPLAGGGGGQSSEDEEDDDHPLEHEGPGGYTPACGDS